jgi:hypothetical protein
MREKGRRFDHNRKGQQPMPKDTEEFFSGDLLIGLYPDDGCMVAVKPDTLPSIEAFLRFWCRGWATADLFDGLLNVRRKEWASGFFPGEAAKPFLRSILLDYRAGSLDVAVFNDEDTDRALVLETLEAKRQLLDMIRVRTPSLLERCSYLISLFWMCFQLLIARDQKAVVMAYATRARRWREQMAANGARIAASRPDHDDQA